MFKQVALLVLVLFVLSACRPNGNQIARDVVMHYCDTHYKHYQPLDFEKAQEYYIPFERSKQYISYSAQQKAYQQKKDSLRRLITIQNKPAYLLQAHAVDSTLNSIVQTLAQNKKDYKPQRNGWMIVHTYNQQPVGEPLTRNTSVFIVDEGLKKILETYEK